MKKNLIEYNKKIILNAAKNLFLENGISKTTVDEIARVADYSKATIYVYFKNKEDIYNHIVLEYMRVLKNGIKEASSNQDFEEGYYSLCYKLENFAKEYPIYFECILGNIKSSQEDMEQIPILKEIFDCGEEINTIVCKFIDNAKRKKKIKADVDPIHATFVLWSSICGIIQFWTNKKEYLKTRLKEDKKDFLRKGFEMILNSMKGE